MGIKRLSLGSPLSDLATVNTPCLGEYCPLSKQARVGAQLGALA